MPKPRTDLPPEFPDEQKLVPPALSAPPRPPIDWERFLGVKLFAWLGGLALFLGVFFLVKYSFENSLITPLGRVVIGLSVGLGLLATGWWLARGRYRTTAQSLCATGIVILYANIFAAHSFYGLISLTTAFFAMAAGTLGSFLLAVNLGAQVIVILGLLGGFLTPVLLPSGADNARALFIYVALLDLGVAAVALRKRWLYLVLLAALGTVFTQLGWAWQFFNASKGGEAFWIFPGFEALFLALFFGRGRRESPNGWLAAAAAVVGFTALLFGFWIAAIDLLACDPFYFFAFVFLADAGLLSLPVLGRVHREGVVRRGSNCFRARGGMDRFVRPAPSDRGVARRDRDLLAPARRHRACLRLARTIFAVHRHRHAHAVSAPDPAHPSRGALESHTGFRSRARAHCGAAGGGDRETGRLARGRGIVRQWAGRTELADGAFLAGAGRACADLLRAAARLLRSVSVLLRGKGKGMGVGHQRVRAGGGVLVFRSGDRGGVPEPWMGLLPAAFVVPGALGLVALRKIYHADPATGDARLAWQGGALLLFVSLVFPFQFEREWITLGWALEGVALLALFHRVPHRGLRVAAVLQLAAAFVRLALNPAVFEYHKRTGTPWEWFLYAYGITTASLPGGAAIFGGRRESVPERVAPAFLCSLGTILASLLLNLEIAIISRSGQRSRSRSREISRAT